MSMTQITIERINKVEPHPNADRLDIVHVLGYTVVVGRGDFKVGDAGVYFPPDMLIPQAVAEDLGVAKYLKSAVYPGDVNKTSCRIGACRLRGVPSYGFLVPHTGDGFGTDVTIMYAGKKYEPPANRFGGDMLPPYPGFHKYTNIQHFQQHPEVFEEGELVRICEKAHGSQCRVGIVDGELMAGSSNTRRKQFQDGNTTMYWKPLEIVQPLLENLKPRGNVIVFGEIFGPGIQDMDYGHSVPGFRVFDISINGHYLGWECLKYWCDFYDVLTVPLLACEHFSRDLVASCTDGMTTMAINQIQSKFKGREGCVITSYIEGQCYIGRKILKSVSVDYYARRGAKDLA